MQREQVWDVAGGGEVGGNGLGVPTRQYGCKKLILLFNTDMS
jgi:hypothetical protein